MIDICVLSVACHFYFFLKKKKKDQCFDSLQQRLVQEKKESLGSNAVGQNTYIEERVKREGLYNKLSLNSSSVRCSLVSICLQEVAGDFL